MMRAAVLLLLTVSAGALRVEKDIGSAKPWQFVGHFAFGKVMPGTQEARDTYMEWELEGVAARDDVEIWVFSDMQKSWGTARRSIFGEGAAAGEDFSQRCREVDDGHDLSVRLPLSPGSKLNIPDHLRDRVWYVYLASKTCNATIPSGGSFSIHFRNAGGFFRAELGKDTQFVLETALAGCGALVLFVAAYALSAGAVPLRLPTPTSSSSSSDDDRKDSEEADNASDDAVYGAAEGAVEFHPVMQLFAAVVALQAVSYALLAGNYWHLAGSGAEVAGLRVAAEVVDAVVGLLFLVVVMLYAMQFKVVDVGHSESLQRRRVWLVAVFAVLLTVHFLLSAYRFWMAEWSTLYIYETPPGLLLASLRVPLAVYYACTLRGSLAASGEEGASLGLSWRVGGVFMAYIIALPCFVLVAFAVDPWVRFKVVFMADVVVKTLTMVAMGCLLWPGGRVERLLASGYTSVPTQSMFQAQGDGELL
eukprot:TRINITY_DN4218_c0_g6_i3.p1 TRINITY_DN4218_c0_g6~~TRINITY_DN4218_c0_g6_i3.p1  ORF type:complete len:476 (+),score=178.73 TRINITY_DN4218_c0_g6_i3:59-1486(+)